MATEVSLVLAATFWGLNFAATKYAAASISPLLLVALRFTVGGLLLLLVVRLLEPKSRLRRSDVLPMAALGCFGVATAQTGFTFGVSLSRPAARALYSRRRRYGDYCLARPSVSSGRRGRVCSASGYLSWALPWSSWTG